VTSECDGATRSFDDGSIDHLSVDLAGTPMRRFECGNDALCAREFGG
jgi:hypothetical protein